MTTQIARTSSHETSNFRLPYRLILAFVFALFFEGFPAAQAQLPSQNIAASVIMQKIADYALPGDDRITRVLGELGYSPTPSETTWRAFPAVRKLATAYKAAESATSGDGNRLLAATIRKLSSDIESIGKNAEMSAFADGHYGTAKPFRFSGVQSQFVSIDHAAYHVIINIADQVERGALGGAGSILTRDLMLSEADAFEILSSSSSNSEALIKAYQKMGEADRIDRLIALGKKLQANYSRAARDDTLRTSLAALSNPLSLPGQGKGSPSSGACPPGQGLCTCGGVPVGCRTPAQCSGPC
jgi:hypothetical protein